MPRVSPYMDVILTGIPRSGTTLACLLLNKLPGTVALHEPMNPADLVGLADSSELLKQIADFFRDQRSSLLAEGRAVSKVRGGKVPDNPFAPCANESGLRPSTIEVQNIRFYKTLDEGFRLVIKHPNCFTATLDALCMHYNCFAIVRNPLAVLLSWHSINAPVNQGRVPFGEAFDPMLRQRLAEEPDLISRQLCLLRWYFSKYSRLLPPENILRYEEIVSTGGRALKAIDPDAKHLKEKLVSQNSNRLYDASLVMTLADRLVANKSVYQGFYSKDDIVSLMDSWKR